MKRINTTVAGLLFVAFCSAAWPQDGLETPAETTTEVEQAAPAEAEAPAIPEMNFKYQSGDILLPNKVATLHLDDKYRYLDAAETNRLLMAWGNESDLSTQGAIVPGDVDPMSETGWAVILTYRDDGHVDDSDANEIDYTELLKEMQASASEHNKARREANYPAIDIIGWAETPRYDAATHKLYWAKELEFEGSPVRTLNYDVRVLGREGVLSMNAVATMGQLGQIRTEMRPLIEVAEFNEGYRYAEFDKDTDRMAEYGLGALVAGTLAAKLGFFGKIFAALLVFKKFIFMGLVAAGALIAKMFGRKKDESA